MLWSEDWLVAAQDSERVTFAHEVTLGPALPGQGIFTPINRGERQPPASGGGDPGAPCWKILVVDDNRDVQVVTQAILRSFSFDGKPLCQLCASSGQEARQMAAEHGDLALILMDVVMESDQAGLDAINYIRNTLGNRRTRIVLRTGQPGFAPEENIIANYDINDYREKADLSSKQLRSLVTTQLRNYRQLLDAEQAAMANRDQEVLVREQVLRNDRDDLVRAQRIAHVGSWVWQVSEDRFSMSVEACRLLGCPVDGHFSFQHIVEGTVTADQQALRQSVLGAMASEATGFWLESHILNPQGNPRPVRHVGEITRHTDGQVIRVDGTILEIQPTDG